MGLIESKETWTNQSLYQVFLSEFIFEKELDHHILGKCGIYHSRLNPKMLVLKNSQLSIDPDYQKFLKAITDYQNMSHPNILTCYGSLSQVSNAFCSKIMGNSIYLEFYENNCREMLRKAAIKKCYLSEKFLRDLQRDLNAVLCNLETMKIKFQSLALESIFFTDNNQIKLFPEAFFDKKKPEIFVQDQKDMICDIMLNMATLNYEKNYFDREEKFHIIIEKYGIEFLDDITDNYSIGKNKKNMETDEKNKDEPNSPQRTLTKNMVSFQDETFFMSPIKSEDRINNPICQNVKKSIFN